MLTLDLLLKGLGSSAALGTVGCLGYYCWDFEIKRNIDVLTKLVGLDCDWKLNKRNKKWEGECTIAKGKKVRIKKGSEIFDATSLTGKGKIKLYKASENEKYKEDLKFVIEKEDITVNDAGNKLEEYETYSLKRQGVWRLELKTTVDEGIKRELRLPEDCNLPTEIGGEGVECDISGDKFKNINFDLRIKKDVKNLEVTPKLKIYKLKDTNNDYGEKYRFKFVLKSEQDTAAFGGSGTKANTNTEYKIKTIAVAGTSWDELTLEKAWTLDSLGAKVGLDCKDSYFLPSKECGFTQEKINLFNDSGNYTTGASLNSTDTTKKIKVERDQEGYNQGFKFFVEGETDITLTNGKPTDGGEKKIEKKETSANSPTYEIKEQTLSDGATDWYLSKVTATANTQVVQQAENAAATES